MQTELNIPSKTERIATRVTPEHKSLFGQAAGLRGLSLTDFMVNAAYDAAIRTLEDSQTILELGKEDTKAFVSALLEPVEDVAVNAPNLYQAYERRKIAKNQAIDETSTTSKAP